MTTDIKVIEELKAIRADLGYIKEHMVDVDATLTEEDYIDLQKYRGEKKNKRLASHASVKRELGL
ncbi:hypothetical protein J4210_02285 [Candidatus Woesearchaeota archaeon]|nr:hypothetical protein [Candidatus Woesearchaeota archaeon]